MLFKAGWVGIGWHTGLVYRVSEHVFPDIFVLIDVVNFWKTCFVDLLLEIKGKKD